MAAAGASALGSCIDFFDIDGCYAPEKIAWLAQPRRLHWKMPREKVALHSARIPVGGGAALRTPKKYQSGENDHSGRISKTHENARPGTRNKSSFDAFTPAYGKGAHGGRRTRFHEGSSM